MELRNPESAAFAVDIPSVGAVGIEPGATFEVSDPDVAAQLIEQGFEPADAAVPDPDPDPDPDPEAEPEAEPELIEPDPETEEV